MDTPLPGWVEGLESATSLEQNWTNDLEVVIDKLRDLVPPPCTPSHNQPVQLIWEVGCFHNKNAA